MSEQTMSVQCEYSSHESKTERRAWVRFHSKQATMASTPADSAATGWLGQVRDLSHGGVALILQRGFVQGTHLILDLETSSGELRRLPAQVVHARCEMDDRWILGCKFASPLNQKELQDLLGSVSLTAAEKFPSRACAPQHQ